MTLKWWRFLNLHLVCNVCN
ncbi:unnamed protein product [Linum tenue]|uniref:Uncharacterized protein n=1 Tax=Linum tenue TaxID=586396 RepID=A0AAV0N9C1_9ROSI|nr:unnamed protein product [Linum tenue]CAI0456284.1 unnamed protein product [Linum tenue]